jgi:hypothetical protein
LSEDNNCEHYEPASSLWGVPQLLEEVLRLRPGSRRKPVCGRRSRTRWRNRRYTHRWCLPSRCASRTEIGFKWKLKKNVTWKQIRKFKMNRNILEQSNTENEILMNSKSFDCELKAFRWFQLKVRLFYTFLTKVEKNLKSKTDLIVNFKQESLKINLSHRTL